MTDKTLTILHNAYEKALCNSSSIVGTVRRLKEYLEEYRSLIPSEDMLSFDTFLGSLDACYHYRRNTSEITVMVTYLSITILAILAYISQKTCLHKFIEWYENVQLKNRQFFADVIAGRKSLESDLTKFLIKAIDTPEISAANGDFFGMCVVLLNEEDFTHPRDAVRFLSKEISKILSGQDPSMRNDFIEWVKTHYSQISLPAIEVIMSIPFSIDKIEEFDKSNGYHSIHIDYTTKSYSPYSCLKGIPLEIQYQTYTDFLEAKNGSAAHWHYKEGIDEKINNVFCLDDYTQTQIPGLRNDLDIDGIKKKNDMRKNVAMRRTQMYD